MGEAWGGRRDGEKRDKKREGMKGSKGKSVKEQARPSTAPAESQFYVAT